MNQTKGFLALLSAAIIFGTWGIWIRLLSRELNTFQQIGFRQLVALFWSMIIIFILKRSWSLKKVKKINLIIFGISQVVGMVFFVSSMLMTKINTVVFSFYGASIIVSLLSGILFFREKLSRIKAFSLIFAFIGLGFYALPFSFSLTDMGIIAALIAGALDTVANSYRKLFGGQIDRFIAIAIQMAVGIPIVIFLLYITRQPIVAPMSPEIFLVGLFFGSLLMIVNYLIMVGFQNFDLNLGTIVFSSEILFASLFAALVYKELPSFKELSGAIFISLSIIIPNLPKKFYGRD